MSQATQGKKSVPTLLRTVDSLTDGSEEEQTPQWVINIDKNLEEGHTYDAGRLWTIYRVPNRLRHVQRSAFIPKLISIGPFHYRDRTLQAMEEHKMRYLLRLLGGKFQKPKTDGGDNAEEATTGENISSGQLTSSSTTKLKVLVEKMKLLEQKARACYSENFVSINSEEFVRMMVVDGCFVVELLRLFYNKFVQKGNGDDPIFTTRWMLRTVQRDLIMLENQLPFFVLEELFKLTSKDELQEPLLPTLTVAFFNPLLPRDNISEMQNLTEEYTHLLDLFRSTFLYAVRRKVAKGWNQSTTTMNMNMKNSNFLHIFPGSSSSNSSEDNLAAQQLIHHAEELQEAGISIRKPKHMNSGPERDLLDISFCNGVLEIPPLHIDDNTVPLFLNFVAFEQSDHEASPFFTNLFIFLDSMIYSETDIRILHKYGIMSHVLGSDHDVAVLINKLGREIVHDESRCYLAVEMKEVNEYCKAYYEVRWRNIWRNLIHKYFSTPWSLISLGAAATLLILTFFQTFYTMYPYYKGT